MLKKRILSMLLAVAMVLSLFPGVHAAAEDTVQIGSWEQFLAFLSEEDAGHYELTADIAAPADMEPIGGFTASGKELEGNGHTVSGLKLKGALFGSLKESTIRTVVFRDVTVAPADSGNDMAVLALTMDEVSFVSGCTFGDVRMTLAETTGRAAVVAARNQGTITNCTVEASVTVSSSEAVRSGLVGGIAALNDSYAYIINCISRAKYGLAEGSVATVAGIVGANHSVVQYCFADVDGQSMEPVAGTTASGQITERCVYRKDGTYTMVGGQSGKDYASMDVYQLAAEMTELVMSEYDQNLDLAYFSEMELGCPWSVEDGGLALSLDGKTAQIYLYVDKELDEATLTTTDPYARKVDPGSYTGRKYAVRVGRRNGESYERYSFTVSLELPYDTMAKNYILRPNPSFVKKLDNAMDGGEGTYADMYLVPLRSGDGTTQTYSATKGLYPFCMTLSLTQMKPGDALTDYCFAGSGTAELPYQISEVWELSLLADYVTAGASANGIEFSRAHYVLTADLDLTDWTQTTMSPIGDIDQPFRGVFDGQGHYIRGFTVNNSRSYMGLFGVVQGDAGTRAQIRDLVVYDVDITGPAGGVQGDLRGGLVGRAAYADLVGVVVTGSVTGGTQIGGIAGYTYNSNIYNCGSVVTLNSYSSRAWVGGICGNVAYGDVVNCYADVDYVHNNVVRKEYLQVGTIAGELKEAQLARCWYDSVGNTALFDVGYTIASDKATMTSETFARELADYAVTMELGVSWQIREGAPYPVPIPDTLAEHSVRCVKSSQGTLTADKTGAVAGTVITVSVDQLREGTVLTGIVVLDRNYRQLYLPVTAYEDGSFSFVMPSVSVYVAPVYDSGALYGMGTEAIPYLIRSYEDLELMASLVTDNVATIDGCVAYDRACYRLTGDIDLGGQILPRVGSGSRPFYGWFDGDGHALYDFQSNGAGLFMELRAGDYPVSISDLVLRDARVSGSAILAKRIQGDVTIQDLEIRDITFTGSGTIVALEASGDVSLHNSSFKNVTFETSGQKALLVLNSGGFDLDNVAFDHITGVTALSETGGSSNDISNVVYRASELGSVGSECDLNDWSVMAMLSARAESMTDASLWGEDPEGGLRLMFGQTGAVSRVNCTREFDVAGSPLDPSTATTTGKGGTHVQIPYDALFSIEDLEITGPNGLITPIVTETADGTPVIDFLMPEGQVTISNGGNAFRYKGLLGGGTEANPYLIETAEELKFFADVCNGTISQEQVFHNVPYIEAYVRLLGDISMDGIAWEGVGINDDESLTYVGHFDGDGHTVSDLNKNAGLADGERQGLFVHIGAAGVVEDLIVTGADISTNSIPEVGTGVIARSNDGIVRRCLVVESTIANGADTYCGGIVGVNRGYVEDCGIVRSTFVRTDSRITSGAVVHTNFGTVSGCYAYDVARNGGTRSRGAVVVINDGSVEGYYYTQEDIMEEIEGVEAMTQEAFADGTVAFALNDGVTDGSQSFYQIIDSTEPADLWPVPVVKDGGTVYRNECPKTPYTNYGSVEGHFRDAVNGFCPRCDACQPAVLVDDGEVYEYQVSNAGQLFWVAREQNERQTAVAMNVRLMADIDVNPGYTFGTDGTVTYEGQTVTEGWRSWTPIGIYSITNGEDHQFHGKFMGDGHSVSGLYLDDPDAVYVGLIGYMLHGWVMDVSVLNSYFRAGGVVGGVVGGCGGNVRGCYSEANIVSDSSDPYLRSLAGSLIGDIGYKYSEVYDSLAMGTANGAHVAVGDHSFGAVYEDNFYLSDAETEDGGRTAAQLASGEVCMALQSDITLWGQKIGTDPHPVLGGPKVYAELYCDGSLIRYGNQDLPPVHVGLDENGICKGCGEAEPAVLVDGVYEIWSVGQLVWFGRKIVEDPYVQGRLMADLTVISDSWVPLGQGVEFHGGFDGNGHTITMELDFGTEPCDAPVGLFSNSAAGAYFRDLTLKGSLVCNSDERVGALIGSAYDTTIEGIVSYVDVTNTCTGEYGGGSGHPGTGGITGLFGGGTQAYLMDCAVYADVTAGYACVGGLVGRGWPGKQYYAVGVCTFVGDITASTDIPAGTVVGYHDTDSEMSMFADIYYNEKDGMGAFGKMDGTEGVTYLIEKVEQKSLESFGSGAVAYLLSPDFGQAVGTEPLPLPGSPQVYRVTNCVGGWTYSNVNKYKQHRFGPDGICELCGGNTIGLELSFPSLSFEDEIHYNVYFTVDDSSRVVSMGLAVFDARPEEGTVEDAAALVEGYVTNGGYYMVRTPGIAAKNMGDTLYFRVYACLDDGTYVYSELAGYDATAYARQILDDAEATDEMKSLVVALVRYGAEAQKYFDYRTDALMDGFLSDDQKALVVDYDPALVADLVAPPASMTGALTKTEGGYEGAIASFSFEGALALNIYMGTALPVDRDVELYWWDMDTMTAIDEFTVDNATGTVTMVPTGVAGHYWAAIEGIPAKRIDESFFFAAVYEQDGSPVISGVWSYSVGTYCKQIAAREGSDQQMLAKATAVYGYYAKTYFQSIGMMQ